jgi:hypothetical protein
MGVQLKPTKVSQGTTMIPVTFGMALKAISTADKYNLRSILSAMVRRTYSSFPLFPLQGDRGAGRDSKSVRYAANFWRAS